ncbi:TIP41-like protein isoform X2 [Panicum virgatum]|uniref:TIP41-like protein isoform X2 n=1 Tax=Panicum virgatum TaxID=38727 RepID=UPI0019D5CB4A|nr:TIP41-like protein isoform X2 [Panicum virgatum]
MASAAAWEGPTAAELKAAGAEAIPGGVRVKGWVIQSHKGPILNAASLQRKPSDQVILDYDYTFTTPYCGSDAVVLNSGTTQTSLDGCSTLCWEDTNDWIDLVALSAKEPILFYDEVILYEDELADNGISFLTVRVRVMPTGWFLLLRFWLRVDGVLMRLRDTRLHCSFGNGDGAKPVVLRECCWREATFASLSAKGYPSDSAAYADPNLIAQKLPIVMQKTQKLKIPN